MTYDETKAAAHLMLEWGQARQNGFPFTLQERLRGCNEWTVPECPSWNWSRFEFRRKPEPKVVPLAMDDVPQNSWLKNNEDGTVMLILRSDEKGIYVVTNVATICCLPYACLMGKMSIDRRDGKGWVPCEKECQ